MRLLLFLYNIILIILAPAAFLIGFIVAKKKGMAEGFGERFGLLRLNHTPRMKSVWFHGASVGEVRSIKNIVDKIRSLYPDTAIIVSTMTITGRKTAMEYIKADEAFLLPIENATAIGYLIKLMGVKIFFVIDTEIWPNMIMAASKQTPLFMINGRISQNTFNTYMRFRFLFSFVIKKFNKIFAKSDEDTLRFNKIAGGKDIAKTAGNIKFQTRKNIEDIPALPEFQGKNIFLGASLHPGEEEFLLENIKESHVDFNKIILVPRHINRSPEIKILCEKMGYQASLYSEKNHEDKKVIIIDAFGLLESLYIVSNKIFIGGSVAQIGGHNVYEALQFYKNAASGAAIWNFKDIFEESEKHGLVTICKNGQDFQNFLKDDQISPKESFDAFFKSIDEKNDKIIDLIISETEIYLKNDK